MSTTTAGIPAIARAGSAPQRAAAASTAAHGLLDVLAEWGVQRIYCCPGSTEASLLDALATRDDVRLVLVTHESVAVAMAEGEARATGRPSVAYVHTHLGMANALAHLSSAQLAYAPVVVLNGLKASTLSGRLAFTAADPREMVAQHVKWAHVVAAGAMLPSDVDRALHVATSEPTGPVWLGLPQDLMESAAPAHERSLRRLAETSAFCPSEVALTRAAELLGSARRPVLVAGADIVRRSATDALLALADRLGAPVLEESRRDFVSSVLPTSDPRRVGRLDQVAATLDGADVVAYLGCRMFTEFEKPDVPGPVRGAATIHLHSDPAEVGRLHAVDVAMVGDPGAAIEALLDRLPVRPGSTELAAYDVSAAPAPALASRRPPGHRHLQVAVDALAAAVEAAGATVVLDATTATGALLDTLRTSRAGQVLGSTSGSLGWGLGASLGVAVADPGTPVVCVIGDGAFQFGVPALWVARQLDAPVTFVVLNNGLYAAVASALGRFDGEAAAHDVWPGTDIRGLDISAVATAFGLWAQRSPATDPGLDETLRRAVSAPGPALVEILTGETEAGR